MPVAVTPYRMVNTANASRKPSSSSIQSGVHSPARQSPDPPSNVQHHRNLSPNSAGMLGTNLNSWPATWSSSNASSDNLTNRTASVSSPSSFIDSAPLTDSPHRSPLNIVWDVTPKAPTLGSRGYPTSGEWGYSTANSSDHEQSPLEIHANQFSIRTTRQQHIASALSANPNAQDAGGRYPSSAPLKSAIQHTSFGSDASNHSAGLPVPFFGSVQPSPSDTEGQLASGMRRLAVEEPTPHSAYNPNHGRNFSHVGGFGIPSGMPIPAPPTPTVPTARSVSLHQVPDASAGQAYTYNHYYSGVPGNNFNPYSFGTPGADPPFSSPVMSTASHPISYGLGGYSSPTPFYYNPAPGMLYQSPQMGPAPSAGRVMGRMIGGSKGTHFRSSTQLPHQERMLISAMVPGTGAMVVSSDPFSQYAPSNPVFGMSQGHNSIHHPQSAYQLQPRPPVFPHAQLDPSATGRSPLLEQFRADKSKTGQLRDIRGHVAEFCGDQHGSRFIQQKLETATDDEKEAIFAELAINSLLSLMTDVFGNYVIQKLFEFGSPEQRDMLVNIMEGHMLSLSLQMYGCRVVQKAIECISLEQQAAFVREIDADVMRCVKDANGNHVIQKLIERVSPDLLGFVSAFQGNVYDLATHPYGCRVLQRCFEYLHGSQTRPLIDELHKYTTQLMQDQFGNYVIQFVLEHGAPADREWILHKLRGQMVQMAKHKFASNVCEKALVTADSESRQLLIEELMTPRPDAVNPIVLLMKDSFGNYVLQRALQVVEGEQRQVLVSKVKPQLNNMRRYSSAYSKHLASIEKLLNERPDDESNLLRGLPSSDAPVHSTLGSALS